MPDSGNSRSKYREIAAILEDFIISQSPAVGSKFFADRALAKHFAATTVTIGRSLNILVEKNMLERRIGAGTFVTYDAANPKRKKRIGVLCHEVIAMDSVYVAPVMHTFNKFWDERGYQVISFYSTPKKWRQFIQDYELDGVMILVPREEFAGDILKLHQENYPVVSIGYAFPELKDISFGSDHGAITIEAVEYLYNAGHRRIALLFDDRILTSRVRSRSFQQAMWERRLPVSPDWIMQINQPDDASGKEFAKKFKQIFRGSERPTAILLDSVFNIFAVYHLAEENNLRIPEDLSVVGFNDAEFLQYINPPLTVIDQPLEAITTAAAEKILNMIEKKNVSSSIKKYNNKLIERKSTAKIL